MMYRHKRYGIIWYINNERNGLLVKAGGGYSASNEGKWFGSFKDTTWDDGNWDRYGFNEYIKLLNK